MTDTQEIALPRGLHKYYPGPLVQQDGCVPLHEHPILAAIAMMQRGIGHYALEIGTLYGEQTANIARALPDHFIITVDIPPDAKHALPPDAGDLKYVGKQPHFPPDVADRIEAMRIDSALLALPPAIDLGFTFIDGAHSYEYALNDFHKALASSVNGAIIAFHDMGIWPGVTRAVNELIAQHPTWEWYAFEGTSLVWLRVRK